MGRIARPGTPDASPVLQSTALPQSAEFYGALGLEEVMNHGWIMTPASAENPAVQLSLMTEVRTAPVFVRDPGGRVVSVLSHRCPRSAGSTRRSGRPGDDP
ncbi:hypothetical protein ACWCQS_23555 [Streptomyces sp. NPDC002076]